MATLDVIIKQMILAYFRSAEMDSASPGHINRFKGMSAEIGLIGSNEEINAAIREAVGDMTTSEEGADKLAQDLLDSEEKTGKKKKGVAEQQFASGVKGAFSERLQDPVGMMADTIPLLPHKALITLAVLLTPIIFETLTKPGGPLDLRFKRVISDEINAFLSRQTQRDTEMGVRQVIIQSKTGFTAVNGFNNYNTLKGIREGGVNNELLSRVGKVDHSKGIFDFG